MRLSTIQSLVHSALADLLLCVRSGAGHRGHGGGQGGTEDVQSGRAASFQHLRAGAVAVDEAGLGMGKAGEHTGDVLLRDLRKTDAGTPGWDFCFGDKPSAGLCSQG